MNPKQNPHRGVSTAVVFITPETAKHYLGSNFQHQRKISKKNLGKIEEDLRNDRYRFNGEPIIIGKTGILLDGQHRLCASVNTKIGFWSVVVSGIEDDCFHFINVGKSRSLADVLKIAGEVNCNNLACAITRIGEYLRNPSMIGGKQSLGNPAISTPEAMDILAITPSIRQAVAENCFISSDSIVSCGRIAWLHCLAHEECPDHAPEFFHKLRTGENLSVSSPVYVLRARLLADKQSTAKLPMREVLALIVKGWNAYIAGETPKQIRWITSEPFPILSFGK